MARSQRLVVPACALAFVICTLAVLWADEAPPASATPPNDTFANAITIDPPLLSGYVIRGSNVGATIGSGPDPLPSCTGNLGRSATVWYSWFSPTSAPMSFDTFGSDFDTALAIYTSNQSTLTEVACSNDFGSYQSAVRAQFAANTMYYIQISSPHAATGNIVLNSARGMDMVVTGSNDENVSDTYLTLREAMLMAQGSGTSHVGRPLTPEEAALILGEESGGGYTADIIHFTPNSFYPNSPTWIALSSPLPQLTDTGNTLSGLGAGVVIDGQNLNFTCLDITSAGDNVEGLEFRRCAGASFPAAVRTAGNNTIIGGSSIPGQRNVFSTNGVAIAAIPPGTGNMIFGNKIGTNIAGTVVSTNKLGIAVTGANNHVGGSGANEGNVLGGSTYEQIVIRNSTATGNTVQGNQIGGMSGSSGAYGVRIDTQAHDNTIGGTGAGEGNVIDSATVGVSIESGPNNLVQGNKIGTDAAGSSAKPNNVGVQIESPVTGATIGVTVGGITAGARNVISGNTYEGLKISGANGNIVQGNYIGSNAAGTAALGNGQGMGLYNSAGNSIGGTAAGASNLISGNASDGVLIDNSGGNNDSPNVVLQNIIGSHPDSLVAMPNSGAGLHIQNSAGNQIGSTAAGGGNIIGFNNAGGVQVDNGSPASNSNMIRGNSIFGNVGLGIDLTGGANGGIAAPVITSTGSAHGTACGNCTVDVYSDSEDEGRVFQGTATADGSGNWSYLGAVVGPNVTAVATDGSGNSSEFSAPFSCGACNTPTPIGGTSTPTASPTPTPTAAPTLTPVGETPSPTPTATPSGTPNTSETPAATATGGSTATPTPTATLPGSSETPTPTLTQTPSPSGSATTTPVSPPIQGDGNCDGHVDLDDVLTILEESDGLPGSCEGSGTLHHAIDDVNCDGMVNDIDALDVLRHLVGMPELSIPIGCTEVGEAL